jgi:pilus assembly protein CpaC
MRKTLWGSVGVLLIAMIGTAAVATTARSADRTRDADELAVSNSVLHIPARADFPLSKRVDIGKGKSLLVQFPFELKDVLVADPETADAVVQSSNRVFLIAKKIGTTNAFFFDSKGQQILTLEISIGSDLRSLDSLLRRLIPGSNVQSELAGGAIVLTGTVRTPADSKRANDIATQFAQANVNALGTTYTSSGTIGGAPVNTQTHVQGQSSQSGPRAQDKMVINLLVIDGEEQVMLKVTVVEMQRTILKQLGVNVGALLNNGSFSTAVLSQNALPLTAAAGLGSLPTAGVAGAVLGNYNPGPSAGVFGNSGVDTVFKTGNTQLSAAMRAMERDGLARTLAEPTLTAVSGETAKFLAGGEFPIPVVDSDGKLSVTFKEFGVGLSFTPVVLSEGRISLRIDTEVSELTTDGQVILSGFSIPALKKRQAKSTVEMPSGGALAIAGLISDSTKQNIDGFPGLKDLPVLGTLFRSRDFTKSETELVVIVTPYMVRPTSRQELARPDDGFAPASDLKANFLGHLNRVYGKGKELPSGGLKGDYGFIVE